MVTLYLARHGETEENVAQLLQGHMPGHLTPHGMAQAHSLAASLPPHVRFDVLLSSDLRRAMHTARILSSRTGLPVTACPLLRERDWGSLTGRPVDEARRMPAFPPDVETVEAMHARAARFLTYVETHYADRCVLAVGHGLFCRCIQATAQGCAIRDIPRWQNAELRLLRLDTAPHTPASPHEEAASAD